jgi:hypothetical protein
MAIAKIDAPHRHGDDLRAGFAMTGGLISGLRYFPVPSMSRERKLRPAIISFVVRALSVGNR